MFTKAKLEIYNIDVEDIITTSSETIGGPQDNDGNVGEEDEF